MSIDVGDKQAAFTAPTSSRSKQLKPSARDLLADREGPLPIWIRAPKSGTEFFTGASRAKLYDWAAKGSIRSVSIREPGQVRGTRLFHLQSILNFIDRCEAASAPHAIT